MFRIMEAEDIVKEIPDGATIGMNAFLVLGAADALYRAVAERHIATGHPANLEVFCTSSFGMWEENRLADRLVASGAVKRVVAGHLSTMLEVMRRGRENTLEVYNMPIGVLSHALRAAAGGHRGYLSKVGLNLFVDPRVKGPGINEISRRQDLVKVVEVDGEEYLFYKTPQLDFAFLRATAADPSGNISFADEPATVDALAMAQATYRNGGKVIVQVSRLQQEPIRADQVGVPGLLVDAVVVARQEEGRLPDAFVPLLSGERKASSAQAAYYSQQFNVALATAKNTFSPDKHVIGRRAAQELKPGQIVNLGVGTPEIVGQYAAQRGILDQITLTVEGGGIGGLPAGGLGFGASFGADFLCDMCQQFDFYDGGNLDICFLGGLEVDPQGNLNVHDSPEKFFGIGGFANITQSTPNVVFCLPFTAKGLEIAQEEGGAVTIIREGAAPKFREKIRAISFSAKNALASGQNVLYVTERCVFKLTEKGLTLTEVMPGIDLQRDILDRLDFDVAVRLG